MKSFIILVALLFLAGTVNSQSNSFAKGSIERIRVHGKGLEGNLVGDSADRFVSVYLPASYKTNAKRHYPVIYYLHGFTDDDAKYTGLTKHWMTLPPIVDSTFGSGAAKEMILVLPNANTQFKGSWYSNSITTGNWEDFIAKELVAFIDAHYRTIAKASSRGLAGHSMGGYGSMRIGERYPEIFSCIYLLSPATLSMTNTPTVESYAKLESIKTFADLNKADFASKAAFATAAAWSPNLNKPPFYLDLPVKDGQLQLAVLNKWSANMPLTTLDQYITNLKQLRAIAFDAGTKDENIAASIRVLDEELSKYGVKHDFEIYEGTHISRIAERIRLKMLPFFSTHLLFDK